jgi:hypothetical protein
MKTFRSANWGLPARLRGFQAVHVGMLMSSITCAGLLHSGFSRLCHAAF